MTIAFALLFAHTQVITLADAVKTALAEQPLLRQAQANTAVAKARAGEARAPLLPQLFGTGQYSRRTSNFAPGSLSTIGAGGATTPGTMLPGPNWDTFNYWNFGITASQTLWDASGQLARWRQNLTFAEAQAATERATRLQTILAVRTAYFAAVAQKALTEVATATLANVQRHLQQIEGFVKVGTRPEIDLAQARTDLANAKVQLITNENNFEVQKATLNQTMGQERDTAYDVQPESIAPVDGEDRPVEVLVQEALGRRPELVSLERQLDAQKLAILAAKSAYGPSLSAATGFTYAGRDLPDLVWNWSFGLTLNWSLFSGGATWYAVKEQKASYDSLAAQRDQLRLQTRVEVEQARTAVRAAKAAQGAAAEALVNARDRLRLAEGRYQAGVGSVIELGDAQVAANNAAAQKVQADYNVSTARAQLLKALGRS